MLDFKSYGKILFVIALPIIIQSLVQYIQLQVDMAMLGHYNPLLLSAVGNVIFPYNIMVSFLTALSTGATILISHNVGATSIRQAKRYSEVTFFYNSLISIPFFLIMCFFSMPIMTMMGTSSQITYYASQFMSILSYSMLFLGLELSIVAILQGVGRTQTIMYAAILRTGLNVILDYILIYGKFGFPEMGIKGAALATTLSNLAALIFYLISFSTNKKLIFKPSLGGILQPKWKIQKQNILVGLPYGMESIFWLTGQLIIVRMVNGLDDYDAGLYVVVSRIQAVAVYFYVGIARATMILVSSKMGARRPDEAIKMGLMSLRFSTLLCIIASILFITMPDKILSIFTSETDLINRVSDIMYIIAITIFPVSINVIIGYSIRGMKDTKWMFYTQIMGTLFVIIMSALVLFVFDLKLIGVFFVVLADESIRACLNLYRFIKGREGFALLFKKIFH